MFLQNFSSFDLVCVPQAEATGREIIMKPARCRTFGGENKCWSAARKIWSLFPKSSHYLTTLEANGDETMGSPAPSEPTLNREGIFLRIHTSDMLFSAEEENAFPIAPFSTLLNSVFWVQVSGSNSYTFFLFKTMKFQRMPFWIMLRLDPFPMKTWMQFPDKSAKDQGCPTVKLECAWGFSCGLIELFLHTLQSLRLSCGNYSQFILFFNVKNAGRGKIVVPNCWNAQKVLQRANLHANTTQIPKIMCSHLAWKRLSL